MTFFNENAEREGQTDRQTDRQTEGEKNKGMLERQGLC